MTDRYSVEYNDTFDIGVCYEVVDNESYREPVAYFMNEAMANRYVQGLNNEQ